MIQSLIAYLLQIHANTWVSTNLLDSEGAGVKVYHQRAKQGTEPKRYVVFNVLPITTAYRHHIGTAATVALQDAATVQFDIYADTDTEAIAIGANLRTLLEGKFGEASGIKYNTILLEAQRSGYIDGQRAAVFSQDYNFRINI